MVNNRYIGGAQEFLEWALYELRYQDKNSEKFYKQMAHDAYKELINNTPGRSYVQIRVCTGQVVPSIVVIELFDDICPKTCDNFRQLCTGFTRNNCLFGYEGTTFNRVVKGMYMQGGDLSLNFCKSNSKLTLILENNDGYSVFGK